MKRFSLTLVLLFGALATTSFAAPKTVTVTIQHARKGCHTWAIGKGQQKAAVRTAVARGTALVFVNNDVMPHKVVKKSGPAVVFSGNPGLNKAAAHVKVVLAKPGVYTFSTVAGEDWVKGVETVGEDNVLKLVVTVK